MREQLFMHALLIVDVLVGTSLINMYGKSGALEQACMVFYKLVVHDAVSWNALLDAFQQQGRYKDALRLYQLMPNEGISVLSACANLAARADGEVIHASITGSEFNSAVSLGNALINMYGKCGAFDSACIVFHKMKHRDVVSWNAMIAVYTQQGRGKEALLLFQQMLQECVVPNAVTFVSVLSACSRAGLVDEAQRWFVLMREDYYIVPTAEHWRCMIDLFGRSGQLDDAEDYICKSQLEADALAWMTLLSACKIHGDMERGIRAGERAIDLDPQNTTPYVLLSNLYAADGRWDDVDRVRKCMMERGVKNEAGNSMDCG